MTFIDPNDDEPTWVPTGDEAQTQEISPIFPESEDGNDTVEVDTSELFATSPTPSQSPTPVTAYLVEVHSSARSARLLAIRGTFVEAHAIADAAPPDADVVVRELALPCDAEAIVNAAAGRCRFWRRPPLGDSYEPSTDPHATLLDGGF